MRVLHVLANGPPDVNGYAIRTQMILDHQNMQEGIEAYGLTSPWYPEKDSMAEGFDTAHTTYFRTLHPLRKRNTKLSHQFVSFIRRQKSTKMNPKSERKIKPKKSLKSTLSLPIRYIFQKSFFFWLWFEEKVLVRDFSRKIIEVSKTYDIDIIHAHTPYRVGLPALIAARKLNVPFVYEMRGVWEETAIANGRWNQNSIAYKRFKRYEDKVIKSSDAVICICESLRENVIQRGHKALKISIVPNAVDQNWFIKENNRSPNIEDQLQIHEDENAVVIGYVGSLGNLEGVDLLLESIRKLKEEEVNIRLLILTGHPDKANLITKAEQLGIDEISMITGPVPHKEVQSYYHSIDIFVVSRPDLTVTNLVTPLKPYEAMAMGKTVIMSRLSALEEMAVDGETALFFIPNDIDSLTEQIKKCINDPKLRNKLGKNAYHWVKENRNWSQNILAYNKVYDELLKQN